jgi:hypothetical protein
MVMTRRVAGAAPFELPTDEADAAFAGKRDPSQADAAEEGKLEDDSDCSFHSEPIKSFTPQGVATGGVAARSERTRVAVWRHDVFNLFAIGAINVMNIWFLATGRGAHCTAGTHVPAASGPAPLALPGARQRRQALLALSRRKLSGVTTRPRRHTEAQHASKLVPCHRASSCYISTHARVPGPQAPQSDTGETTPSSTRAGFALFWHTAMAYFCADFAWIAADQRCVKSATPLLVHHIVSAVYSFLPYFYPAVKLKMCYVMLVEARSIWDLKQTLRLQLFVLSVMVVEARSRRACGRSS